MASYSIYIINPMVNITAPHIHDNLRAAPWIPPPSFKNIYFSTLKIFCTKIYKQGGDELHKLKLDKLVCDNNLKWWTHASKLYWTNHR